MSDLLRLAELCKVATGPDRELEAEIAVAVDGGEIVWLMANYTMEQYPARKYASANHVGGFGKAPVPAYTGSLDAAMALVPEGWTYQLRDKQVHLEEGEDISLYWYQGDCDGRLYATSYAATTELALCAASLRARAEIERLKEVE